MTRRLFWKLCLIVALGVVALFWGIDTVSSLTEERMSYLEDNHKADIRQWGQTAERLFIEGDLQALEQWLSELRHTEQTLVMIARVNVSHLLGDQLPDSFYTGNLLGRSVDWKIHLYFEHNPVMEVPFSDGHHRFLIRLPERMRPGSYLDSLGFSLKIILPLILLLVLCYLLYQHIMNPIKQLKAATKRFSQGTLDVKVRALLGRRSDELSELAEAFDHMTTRISELILSQRQLISELSHELRTPLTRLDIAIEQLHPCTASPDKVERLERESRTIRKLVDDSLTFAWLDNERPELRQESVNVSDLLDVLVDDARFEFSDRTIVMNAPASAEIHNSNHKALGQALENILRNALRFTPPNRQVTITLTEVDQGWLIAILDQGPGIPTDALPAIFKPFYRAKQSSTSEGFGLGLALAHRQILAAGGTINATNRRDQSGLCMEIHLPAR